VRGMNRLKLLALLPAAVAGCTADTSPPDPGRLYLSPTEHLVRASMALRGLRPSLAELRAVDEDPAALPQIVDRYLDSPEFGVTIRELHNEALQLRIQQPTYTMPARGPLADRTYTEIADSLYGEPLRLIEDVVMTGQPYTKIVTADYTMADDIVATIWGLPHSGGREWVRTAYSDGRGAAGVLATSAFHLRYRSPGQNYNRRRAAATARGFLCHDFPTAQIELDTSVDLSDTGATAAAVRSNRSCAGCHQTLDPLAGYFAGFYQGVFPVDTATYPVPNFYREAAAGDWAKTTGRPPSYFGAEAEGLAGLGAVIAADPRFARCAAQRFAAYLTEQPAAELDGAWIARLQQDFVDDGFDAKRLARNVVLANEFRLTGHADPARAEAITGYQKVRPAQYARLLRDLTGYAWRIDAAAPAPRPLWPRIGPVDYLDDDVLGYRVLMGGIDAFFAPAPSHTMTATATLVSREAALRAAAYVVAHDLDVAPEERTLLVAADPAATTDASLRAQLVHLHARIFGELHDADVEPELALFRASHGDARHAWTITLAAMLSDLRTVYY
jgi:hypothetical protein